MSSAAPPRLPLFSLFFGRGGLGGRLGSSLGQLTDANPSLLGACVVGRHGPL